MAFLKFLISLPDDDRDCSLVPNNMNCWKFIHFLLLVVLTSPYLITEDCKRLESKTLENVDCSCDSFGTGYLTGWDYTCFDYNEKKLYTVNYVADDTVTFQGKKQEPPYQSILQRIRLGQIKTFTFKSCSLPNISFSEIIPYREKYPVETIIFQNKRDDNPLTVNHFGNMSMSLKTLNLNDNRLTNLPELLFSNFSQLMHLVLSDNFLQSFQENIFHSLTNLMTLDISNNKLENLPETIFSNLCLLDKLYLFENQLQDLPEGIFKNLTNLKSLDLSNNKLMQLPGSIFNGFTNLIYVNLSNNSLITLPKKLFQSVSNLKEISLSLNPFMEPLPEDLFFGLTQLEKVIINDCNFGEIYENIFAYSPNITLINLERNSLTYLPKSIFFYNLMLKEINLNFNRLNELPPDLLINQRYLETLQIFKNNLYSIPDGLFRKAKNIKTLILGCNLLQNASQVIFADLPALERLDLSYNNLTYFQLNDNGEINEVDLSYNSFTEMPDFKWNRHPKLKNVNLEHNGISYLTLPVLDASSKLGPVINLSHNNIKSVNPEKVIESDRYINSNPGFKAVETKIILTSNPFVCDCELYYFYDFVRKSRSLPKRGVRLDLVDNITCNEPPNLAGKSIMSLVDDNFTCELKKDCPHPCHCYTRAADKDIIMNCSYNKMSSLPSIAPKSTTILFFENNTLINMSGFNHGIWGNLTELILNNNHITDLDHWKIPINLKNISLSGNRIQHLSPDLMVFISNASEFEITLHDNPFQCNCSTKIFKKWLTKHYENVKNVQNITCNIHIPILTTSEDILCPFDDWPYKLNLISMITLCVFLALLLFIVLVVYYRNKQIVIAYVYIHMHHVFTCFFNEDDMDEDKKFDAFVAYCDEDRIIVKALLKELEPKFRLCIHERDWKAGQPIILNIIESVYNSKRTILIISKDSLQSTWIQMEFHAAYYKMLEDKIDRLIIIIRGELPPKDSLDKDLQYVLSTKTYLKWGEKWFWEKITYTLPHAPNGILALKDNQTSPTSTRSDQIQPRNGMLALKDQPASKMIKIVDNPMANLSSTFGKRFELVQNHSSHTMNLVKNDS